MPHNDPWPGCTAYTAVVLYGHSRGCHRGQAGAWRSTLGRSHSKVGPCDALLRTDARWSAAHSQAHDKPPSLSLDLAASALPGCATVRRNLPRVPLCRWHSCLPHSPVHTSLPSLPLLYHCQFNVISPGKRCTQSRCEVAHLA